MSELLWVAVPGGKVLPTGAVLRTLVVPRLSGLPEDADLEAYGFADWPSRLAAARLRVERADEPGPDATEVGASRIDPPAGIGPRWSEVFTPDHLVRAYRPPPVYNAPRVDQSATQASVIRGVYTEAAARPDQPDALEPLSHPSLEPPPPVPQTQQTGTPVVPAPDVHRVLTMLREHPRVLMGMGLIVELRLADPGQLQTGGVIRVICELEQQDHVVTCVSPWTRYVRSPAPRDRFLAAATEDSDIDAGMLRLDPTRWSLETFDVTGAVDRLRDETARRRRAASPGPASAGLPTLRSAGLSLMRHERARQLEERLVEGAMNTRGGRAMSELVLTADHLVLGYRIDVRSTDSGWRSVMQRLAGYTTATGDPEQAPKFLEEGQVKANAVTVEGSRQAHELDAQQQLPALRADEVLTRWDGWSLTCPKPATAAARRDRGRKQLPYLGWSFEPIGLPVLRFGNTYRMRVRVADAAGGGLTLEDPDPTEHQSQEVFYGRHDPVPPPFMVPPVAPAAGPGPGDAVDVLVIRSDPQTNRTVTDFAAQFSGNDRRTLLPPSAPWFLVEQHGLFGDHQDPVEPGEPDEETHARWLARSLEPETPHADGTYSWLPDPMAEGIAVTVRAEPGTPRPGETVHEGWAVPSGAWPDFPFKTLALEEPTAERPERLDWTDNHRRGVVRLRAGEQLSVEVTSTVVSTDTGLFAMEHWLNNPVGNGARLSGASIAGIMELVRSGRHPMVSPAHVLRLVHAVPHPVTAPQGTLAASRREGETFVDLVASAAPAPTPDGPSPLVELGVHVPSTGQVELRSSWSEPVDGGDPQEIRDLPVQVARLAPDASAMPLLRHELGDTRHRVITYRLRAVSRYRDYFPPSDDPAAFAGPALEQVVSVPSSARPPEPVVLSVAPAFRWSGTDLPAGWTEVRRTRAGGVVRVELGRPWLVSGVGEQLAVLLGDGGQPQTAVRRDPIWPTALPPALAADSFRGTVGDAARLPLPEVGADVTAVPYEPAFAPDGDVPGHWFVDVELPEIADASYAAFVSLVVARYQPDSLPGLHLSRAVRAEPVQLLPSRTLRVTRSATDLRITLSGLQPSAPPGPPEGPFDPLTPRRTRVDAHLEELPVQAGRPDVTAVDAQLAVGWRRVATASGEVDEDLELTLPAGDRPLRLVVREVERLRPLNTEGPEGELRDRVVFLDVVPLR